MNKFHTIVIGKFPQYLYLQVTSSDTCYIPIVNTIIVCIFNFGYMELLYELYFLFIEFTNNKLIIY